MVAMNGVTSDRVPLPFSPTSIHKGGCHSSVHAHFCCMVEFKTYAAKLHQAKSPFDLTQARALFRVDWRGQFQNS